MSTSRTKKLRRPNLAPGSVVRIGVEEQCFYAIIIDWPLVGFFDTRRKVIPSISDLRDCGIAFKIMVTKPSFSNDNWSIAGSMALTDAMLKPAWFCNQDGVTGAYEISGFGPTLSTEEAKVRPASYKECVGLERRAAWSATHVERRLLDFDAGRSNRYVESLAILPSDAFFKRKDALRLPRNSGHQ